MKIIADQNIPYINGVLEPYVDEVAYLRGSLICPDNVGDADALIVRTRTRCDATLLEGSRVHSIASATIGSDHIDVEYCRAHGIDVFTAAGSNSGGVLQWVSATLASLAADGGWNPCGKTIGIVGVGHIGSLVARYASAWGFEVLMSDPPREHSEGLGREEGFVPLEELAARADLVTFHVPMVRNGQYPTAHLCDEAFLHKMKSGAVVINSSRGGIVDEVALLAAMAEKGIISCIDTWIAEPAINRELLEKCFIATPHIAGYSAQGKANASSMVVAYLASRLGLPIHDWYPAQVNRVERKPVTWDRMCCEMPSYFDVAKQTYSLKSQPAEFEQLRENYIYRQEFF